LPVNAATQTATFNKSFTGTIQQWRRCPSEPVKRRSCQTAVTIRKAKKNRQTGRTGPERRRQVRRQPEERPQGGVVKDTEKKQQRLADADGARPAHLMRPGLRPVAGGFVAIHHQRRENNAPAQPCDQPAQVVIVGQIIRQAGKAADFTQLRRPQGHDRAERKIHLLQTLRLQHRRPKIRVDGDGLPAHGQAARIGQPVKAVDQPDFRVREERGQVGQKIPGHPHVRVTDDDERVADERLQLAQGGDFSVDTQRRRAEDQLRVRPRKFGQQFAHQRADRIVRGSDPEENLRRAGILLRQPGAEAGFGLRVAILERLEHGAAGQSGGDGGAAMQGKARGGHPPPEGQPKAQKGQAGRHGQRNESEMFNGFQLA
jgi:hypothetical protein